MVLDSVSDIVQAGVAVITLVATVVLALSASRFNRTQMVKLHAEQIDNMNRTIIDIALADPQKAREIGRPVLKDSDIIADYANFTMLNTIYFAWEMRRSRLLTGPDYNAKIDSIALSIQPYGAEYFEAIMKRGYSEMFQKELRKAINRMGGFDRAFLR